jgi:hypothetical protein
MVGVGVHALGVFPRRRGILVASPALPGRSRPRRELLSPLVAALGRIARYRGPFQGLVLGTMSGLLPCPLVYAFLAKGAASGSVAAALATMGALGLGTVPALALVAAGGRALSPLLRRRMVGISGALMVLLGMYTLWRGFAPLPCCAH